jgi:general secretion pathway protein N
MRQRTLLALVGGLVFVGVGVATLPASLLVGRLPPELRAEGVSGSLWNGAADALSLRGAPLGAVSWTADPAALLRARLEVDLDVRRPDGFVRGRLGTPPGGPLQGENITLELPLTALSAEHAAAAWQGDLRGTIRLVRLVAGWPVSLAARFEVAQLRPPGSSRPVGSFALEFDPAASTATQLVGRVRDVDSPLLVRAQLVIRRDRSYVVDGDVTLRPGTPPDVATAVAFLGAPDAAGRRQFQITGTF